MGRENFQLYNEGIRFHFGTSSQNNVFPFVTTSSKLGPFGMISNTIYTWASNCWGNILCKFKQIYLD